MHIPGGYFLNLFFLVCMSMVCVYVCCVYTGTCQKTGSTTYLCLPCLSQAHFVVYHHVHRTSWTTSFKVLSNIDLLVGTRITNVHHHVQLCMRLGIRTQVLMLALLIVSSLQTLTVILTLFSLCPTVLFLGTVSGFSQRGRLWRSWFKNQERLLWAGGVAQGWSLCLSCRTLIHI